MNNHSPSIVGTHVYTLSPGWIVFLLAFAGVLAGIPLYGLVALHSDPAVTIAQVAFVDLLLLLTAALGFGCAFACLRYRLVLTRDGIEQRQAFTTQRLRNHEVAGWRSFQAGSGPPTIELVPRDGTAKKMLISRAMKTDRVFEDWLAAFPNVDVLEEQRLQREVQADPALGGDASERLLRFSRLRTMSEWAGRLGMAVAIWGLVYPHPYAFVMVLLGVCPLLGLGLVWGSDGRIRFDQKPGSSRPTVVYLMILPAMVMAVRGIVDVSLLDWQAALAVAAVGGALFALVTLAVDREERTWSGFALTLAMVGVPWFYGVAVDLNVRFDNSAPRVYRTTVIGKHETTGKGRVLLLKLDPWGPVTTREEEAVGRGLYDATNPGDTVCVSLNEGAFGWRWYWVDRCAGE